MDFFLRLSHDNSPAASAPPHRQAGQRTHTDQPAPVDGSGGDPYSMNSGLPKIKVVVAKLSSLKSCMSQGFQSPIELRRSSLSLQTNHSDNIFTTYMSHVNPELRLVS